MNANGRQEARIRRGFVDIVEGQVHYRSAGEERAGRPLFMLHASPGSSRMLIPLIERFGLSRRVIAADTLGNGDSSPPTHRTRDIVPYAEAHMRAIDALDIQTFDLYGSHTGANIACEIAIAWPDRVKSLVLDGVSVYLDEERDDMLANYAPGIILDQNGTHLLWIWNFVRDTYLFWPWYRRDKRHRRDTGLPSADVLHDKVVEVLKAAKTYHLPYQAAIAYPKVERLPLVKVPTMLAYADTDMLNIYAEKAAALMPQAVRAITPGVGTPEDAEKTVAAMIAFLDGR